MCYGCAHALRFNHEYFVRRSALKSLRRLFNPTIPVNVRAKLFEKNIVPQCLFLFSADVLQLGDKLTCWFEVIPKEAGQEVSLGMFSMRWKRCE